MASKAYLRKNKQKRTERARKGAIAKFEKYKQMHNPVVVGGCKTYGNLGERHIELLDCGDESMVWIRIDGKLYCPRTMRGFASIMNRWCWRKGKTNS
jgi:hypothetical protein